MKSTRIFRLIEGGLITVFFLQSIRIILSGLLSRLQLILSNSSVVGVQVYPFIVLFAVIVLPWFVPRRRAWLPDLLSLSAILAGAVRILMSSQSSELRIYSAFGVLAFCSIYLISLFRSNWKTWITVVIVGFSIEQLFRAYDTYDLTLRVWTDITIGDLSYRIPMLVVQVGFFIVILLVSRIARRFTRAEQYQPAYLSTIGGLSLGGILASEILILGSPNTIARWSGVGVASVIPWVFLATLLPLSLPLRSTFFGLFQAFDDRLRGLVWLFVMVLLLVMGNRFPGMLAVSALIIAQLLSILMIWRLPEVVESNRIEQVGSSFSLSLICLFVIIFIYSLSFEYSSGGFAFLRGLGLISIVVSGILISLPGLFLREDFHSFHQIDSNGSLSLYMIGMIFVMGTLMAVTAPRQPATVSTNTVRIATYNINSGFNEVSSYQLQQITRTIEASLADIVILQEVEASRPLSLSVDQTHFIARHLMMNEVFFATDEDVRGIAILSKWPIFEPEGALLPSEGIQNATIKAIVQEPVSGRILTIVGVQFTENLSEEARLQQIAVPLSLIGDTSPVILAGDFGAGPSDMVYQQLLITNFVDPDEVLGIERGFTVPASAPERRQDFVLLRGMIPLDSRQVDSRASDHRLVVVEAGWP